jgi:glutamate--cysteine ligase
MIKYNTRYLKENMYKGEFGLEKEGLRITPKGTVADTPHPFGNSESITRDFSEAQLEFVTSIHTTPEGAVGELEALHKEANSKLSTLKTGEEYIWCFSNPPAIENENSIDVAHFKGKMQGKEIYREYLAEKYGKRKMLLSGIHFNFSFPNDLVMAMFENSQQENFRDFKDKLYLDLGAKLIDYSWLIVVLTASSPVFDSSFLGQERGKTLHNGYGSVRCSSEGYWNNFYPYIDYSSIKDYANSIRDYVEQGLLQGESELYCPVRLKPKGKNSLNSLEEKGVNHLEFRLLDVNPLYSVGVNPMDIRFIHLLMLYLTGKEKFSFSRQGQKLAYEKIKKSARYDISEFREEAKAVLDEIEGFFGDTMPKDYKKAFDFQREKLEKQGQRYATKILNIYGKDFIGKGIETAMEYSKGFLK